MYILITVQVHLISKSNNKLKSVYFNKIAVPIALLPPLSNTCTNDEKIQNLSEEDQTICTLRDKYFGNQAYSKSYRNGLIWNLGISYVTMNSLLMFIYLCTVWHVSCGWSLPGKSSISDWQEDQSDVRDPKLYQAH